MWSDKVTQLPWLAAKQSAEDQELPKVKREYQYNIGAFGGHSIVTAASQDQQKVA